MHNKTTTQQTITEVKRKSIVDLYTLWCDEYNKRPTYSAIAHAFKVPYDATRKILNDAIARKYRRLNPSKGGRPLKYEKIIPDHIGHKMVQMYMDGKNLRTVRRHFQRWSQPRVATEIRRRLRVRNLVPHAHMSVRFLEYYARYLDRYYGSGSSQGKRSA